MQFNSNVLCQLIPQVFRSILAISLLPVYTLILNAEDFGFFAILTTISAFFAGIPISGAVYTVSSMVSCEDMNRKKGVVTNLVAFVSVSSLLSSCLYYLLSSFLFKFMSIPFSVNGFPNLAIVVIIFVSPFWVIANVVIVVARDFKLQAVVAILDSVVGTGVTLYFLFVLGVGGDALFAGALAAALVSFVGGVFYLMRWTNFSISLDGILMQAVLCIKSAPSLAIEKIRNPMQNVMFAKYLGADLVGVFSHSQQYVNMMRVLVKSAANAIWSTSLMEAKGEIGEFKITHKCWRVLHLMATFAGVFFAVLGQDFIDVLTNEKFEKAGLFSAILMIVLMFENMGRAEVAKLYQDRLIVVNETALIFSGVVSLLVLFFTVPVFGLWGGVAAIAAFPVFHRFAVGIYVRKRYGWGFRDWTALKGAGLILLAILSNNLLGAEAFSRWCMVVILLGCTIVLFNREAREMVQYGLVSFRRLFWGSLQ
ncbi:MAG: oligosaccharide flippase family protein [Pseudomonadota bacterium]|nr:oligosaccharide flippase family protein [Pseudomonadota bacterium]